jgi:hypothetical protein
MISLLIDLNTQDYDIIAIQKSWWNLFVSTSLSSHQCDFHLLYRFDDDTKMCFFVNDKIDAENWKMNFLSIDICVLTLTVRIVDVSKKIRICNVYNLSSISYSFRENFFSLSKTRRILLKTLIEHDIFFEDFNLHHSFWNDSSRLTQHATVDELLDLTDDYQLLLILSIEIVTWETRNIFSTINLTFMTNYLTDRLEHCMFKTYMRQFLDHISIFTRILLDTISNFVQFVKRRAWKLLDMTKLKKIEKMTSSFKSFDNVIEIDDCVKEIQEFLQKIVNVFVFWAHFSRYVKSFWIKKCDEITKKTRRLRRIWSATHEQHNWTNYMKSNDRKQKIIQKIKKLSFRQKMKKIIDKFTNLWRLIRWTKNKNHALKEVFKMFALKYNDQIADTFDEKVELFKSIFFFAFSSIDFRDIKKFYYSNATQCLVIITENKIIKIINRTIFDNISSSNEIINRFIKVCSNTLTKLLISLFQICATHVYHSIVFKTVNIITLKKSKKIDYIISKIYKSIALLNIIEKVMKFIICKKFF